jgi:hypothetical protein
VSLQTLCHPEPAQTARDLSCGDTVTQKTDCNAGNPDATIPITRSNICVARTPIERSLSALRLLRDDRIGGPQSLVLPSGPLEWTSRFCYSP